MKRMLVLVMLAALCAPALAQGVGTKGMRIDNAKSHRQVLAMGLYPPDIIMRYQQKLGITKTQRKSMLKLVRQFQNDVAELQWNLQSDQEQMRQALLQDKLNEAELLPLIERVVDMESRFKLAHFKLLIAIKNELTADQIEMIRERLKQRRIQ